ncbi:hypothetical protein CR513_16352, partial [Mucuna pruriens]
MARTLFNENNSLKLHLNCERVDNPTYLIFTFLDVNSDKETFLGYFDASKAYKVYNSRTLIVQESIHVRFNDFKPDKKLLELID